MRLSNAQELLKKSGRSAAFTKRLRDYSGNLSTDKDPMLFDDKMRDYLLEISTKPDFIEETVKYLDSIGYTASRYTYSHIEAALDRFQLSDAPYFGWNRGFKEAKSELITEVKSWNLKSLQYNSKESYVERCPKKDAHAGFSYLETGMKTKEEYFETLPSLYPLEEAKAKACGSFNKPILIGTRTQASGAFDADANYERTGTFKSKTRFVSMIDIYHVYGESKTAIPFQGSLSKVDWYAGGKDDIKIHGKLNMLQNSTNGIWTSIDYSSYDQTIPAWLIHECFDIVRAAFWNDRQFDEELFNVVRNDFIHKVFVDGKGKLVYSSKGVPSGSMFTQIIDSLANRLMITTFMKAKGISRFKMCIMGDDNIIFTDKTLDVDGLAFYLQRNFGVTVHPDKKDEGGRTENKKFLSREWTPLGVYRHPSLLVAKLLYPERRREYGPDKADVALILDSYILAFPASIRYLIPEERVLKVSSFNELKERKVGKWLSGLMAYQLQYLS